MQNQQIKTKSKEISSVSKMMAQRDRNKLQDKKRKDFIELLKKPRSKEYMKFLNEKISLEKEICAIEEQISKLEEETGDLTEYEELAEEDYLNAHNKATETVKDKKVNWWEVEEDTDNEVTMKEQEKVVEAKKEENKPAWTKVSISNKDEIKKHREKVEKKQELQRQMEELVQQWEEASRQFEQQLPVPDKVVGAVYCGWFTRRLKRWGAITVSGTAYHSPQELLDITQPNSEAVAQRWLKGDEALQNTKAILVEIYMDVLCLLDFNGDVEVLEE